MNKKTLLHSLFQQAIQRCLPENCLPEYLLSWQQHSKICVLGAGKAAAQMAHVVYEQLGDRCYGAVVTRYGHEQDVDTGPIELLTASHPIPDLNSTIAAKKILALAESCPKEVPIMFLLSGGGSALLSLPAPGISLEQKQQLHRWLLHSGASIDEMNTVRKHLSTIKGGRLAAVTQAHITNYIISDVVGDTLTMVASGPTIYDQTTPQDALSILQHYQWPPTPEVLAILQRPAFSQPSTQVNSHLIANATQMLAHVQTQAQQQGITTFIINEAEQGEAEQVALDHAKIINEYRQQYGSCLLLSGGELTVTIRDQAGDGGPNQHYLLALAIALKGSPGVTVLACDTDGMDGSQPVAGAMIDESTLTRSQALGLDAQHYLQHQNSYHYFYALHDLVITGPTQTNVNDFRAIWIQTE